MLTRAFARDVLIRAGKTFAQSLLALLLADQTDLLHTSWVDNLSVAGMAALVSVLTTVASGATTGSPAIGEAVTPNADVVAVVERSRLPVAMGGSVPVSRVVAGDAAPQPNGTPVTIEGAGPVAD